MILAAADLVTEQGFDPIDYMSAQAVELNKTTYYMLFVQLALRGITAEVIHGNSLSLEVFESAYTPVLRHFISKHGQMFKVSEEGTLIKKAYIQLDLFDF